MSVYVIKQATPEQVVEFMTNTMKSTPEQIITMLQAEVERLKAENDMIFTDAAALTQAVDAMAIANKELRAEVERLNRYAERLRANAERDANEIERLRQERDANEIERLRQERDELITDGVTADAEIERLKAALTEIITLKPEDMPHAIENSLAAAIARAALAPKP